MAYTTDEIQVKPEDGWVEVAENPADLRIKPHGSARAWFVAVTSGSAPDANLVGWPMGRGRAGEDNSFEVSDLTGKVFVRVDAKPDRVSSLMLTVILDTAA